MPRRALSVGEGDIGKAGYWLVISRLRRLCSAL